MWLQSVLVVAACGVCEMRRLSFCCSVSAVVMAVALAGCAPKPGQRALVVEGPPPAPAVLSNQGSELALNRTVAVPAGGKLKLAFVTAINPDCTTIGSTTARAAREPARGKLTIQTADDFVFFPPANPRSACNTKRVRGQLVEYHAAPGFKGTETLAYDVFQSRGGVVHYTVTVNVM